jgi:hypothetical protein
VFLADEAARRHWALGALGLALLVVCARLFLGSFDAFSAAQDLSFFDESQYLAAGVYAPEISKLTAGWAPLYCVWYRIVHAFTHDTIATYHLNAYLIALGFPITWFLTCLALRISATWALMTALAWLVSTANLETLRVGLFAATTVLAGVFLARLVRREWLAWWIVAEVLWEAAYIRPEFLPVAIACVVIGARQLHKGGMRPPALGAWLVAALAPVAILVAIFGFPIGSGRSAAAFQQHLAGNILQWNGLGMEHWPRYQDVIRRYYEVPSGVLDFAIHEPVAFLHHLWTNAARLVTASVYATMRPAQSVLDATQGGALALILVAIAVAMAKRIRGKRPDIELTPASLALAGCASMVIVASVVIYPREHYLALLIAAALLWIAPRADDDSHARLHAVGMLIVAGLVVLMPDYPHARRDAGRPIEETARALRAIDPAVPLKIFDDAGIAQVYAQRRTQRSGPRDFKPPFDRFVDDSGINVIVQSPQLARDPLLSADPAWRRFEADPASLNFTCTPVTNTDRVLCVRAASQEAT